MLQQIKAALGLPTTIAIGAFDALAAFSLSPGSAAFAAGQAVYNSEIAILNVINLGASLLASSDSSYPNIGIHMYTVNPRNCSYST